MTGRTLKVDYLARVEGEGALEMTYGPDGAVRDVALKIFEPPRFFESFLRGRGAAEAPDITARICGICPVAYQMSACAAVEDAWGVTLPPELQALRRALYCGEWIESHVLHMVMLHAPDFLGVPDAMAIARTHKAQVVAGLAVKKAGNALVAMLGGREIHPINVKIGGFYRLPRRAEIEPIVAQLRAARQSFEEVVRWMADFHFPELERDPVFVALQPDDVYPFMEGPVVSSAGLRIPPSQWDEHFVEEHVERSNALHARLHGEPYLTGPLARFALNVENLPDDLKALSDELGLQPPVTNPFRSLLVRGIETLFALSEAADLLERWRAPAQAAVEVTPRAGVGWGATEAPRGILLHRYATDEHGDITEATIIPPTSQNQLAIEADLRALGPLIQPLDDAAATHRAEQAIRNYDPCISCATHFLTLTRKTEP